MAASTIQLSELQNLPNNTIKDGDVLLVSRIENGKKVSYQMGFDAIYEYVMSKFQQDTRSMTILGDWKFNKLVDATVTHARWS